MNERSSQLGSYGALLVLSNFGKRQSYSGTPAPEHASEPVFGKRVSPAPIDGSLQIARLSHLRSELLVLFGGLAQPGEALPFVLIETLEPQLLICGSAVVAIDPESGLYTFKETSADLGLIVVTANEERLLDHIICHLSTSNARFAPGCADAAVQMLIGQTIEDVERRLILHTVRSCHGNRTRAASMLGISLRTIRNKLRSYW
ncbi:helix-turn-helix domain-containing protein [Bradyrhizobium genosp. P]|uniref:helix-turn-helix domain-containing protein n=1 Tax=Bradyrhizobium genosp. P TaxID=83641 RepID=UPI003CF7215C